MIFFFLNTMLLYIRDFHDARNFLQVQFKVKSKYNDIKLVYYEKNQIAIIVVKINFPNRLKNVLETSFQSTIIQLCEVSYSLESSDLCNHEVIVYLGRYYHFKFLGH